MLNVMLLSKVNVAAYLDPGVMTYAIQIIAGVVVAAGAAAGVMWRKARRKMRDKLGIDETTKKEVEEDIVISDSADGPDVQ